MVGNLKRWKDECLALEFRTGAGQFRLTAEKVFPAGEASGVRFSWNAPNLTFREVMEVAGHVPLPPYIKRDDETEDNTRYQTVYSRVEGSVAAPTAGLHFTPEILDTIRSRGINTTELTLHVSAGTFQPVKANNIKKHLMHGEHFFVSKESLSGIIRNAENIIAVGTTSVRTLESLYWAGVRIIRNPSGYENDPSIGQWEPYGQNENITPRESLGALIDYMNRKGRGYLHGTTRLMIVPGYRFRLTGGLMTNFHLPKSTLLLLVSAWVGEDWKKIYNFALENKFRFLSFGDSSLLFNKE
jgi:S-adenosylmethionine:tRNA ribosyltransferase-isomerase